MCVQIIIEFQITSKAKKMQMEVRKEMHSTEMKCSHQSARRQIFSQNRKKSISQIEHGALPYYPALVHLLNEDKKLNVVVNFKLSLLSRKPFLPCTLVLTTRRSPVGFRMKPRLTFR